MNSVSRFSQVDADLRAPSERARRSRSAVFAALALLLVPPVAAADAGKPASPAALSTLTYSGDQAAFEAIDRDLNAAGNAATRLAALEQQLLAALRRKDATFAARQAICQRLGLVLAQAPKADTHAGKLFAAMLLDERDADLARLALERVPGEAIDALLVAALKKSAGRPRLGLIDSCGRRRIASAVAALTPLLKEKDAATAAAAARALGAIASPDAVAALSAFPEPSAPAIAKAKLAAAARTQAVPLLLDLERNAAFRLAAFRALLDADPAGAGTRIAEALSGSEWERKQVALESLYASRAPELVALLTGKLAAWDAPTQAAVIAALGRRAEPAARPAIVAAAEHRDADVQRAALEALGNFPGDRDTAALLARVAADADAKNAKLARQTLARLNGPDVNAALLAGAERGETKLRIAYLEQFGLRNLTEGLPLLLQCRGEADAAVRFAAVAALGEIAGPAEERALIDWTLGATDEAEQARALRSLVAAVQRDQSKERGRAFYSAIENAPADVALRLLPALQRIGGAASADCAARLALRDDRKIAEAAVAALGRWNDRAALGALATVARKATAPAVRGEALKGALTYFEKNREPWRPELTSVLAGLLDAAKDAAPRGQLIGLLGRANDPAALQLAGSLKADPAAAEAAEIIRSNLAGTPTLRVSDNEAGAKNMIDGKTSSRWNTEVNGEEWVEVTFKASRPVHRITLDQTGRATDFPEHYEVFVTDDAKNPGAALASGTGQRNKTVIEVPAGTRGRTLLIKNTKPRAESQWSICELFVD